MRVRIAIEVDNILEDLRRMPDRGKKVGKEVLGAATQQIAALARPLAPRKRGALAGSIRATRPVMTGRGVISAGVVAGGTPVASGGHAANVYAVVQEKGEEHARGGGGVIHLHSVTGQAHFLEVPATRVALTVPDRLIERLDQETR
jgi:hypothetical protein